MDFHIKIFRCLVIKIPYLYQNHRNFTIGMPWQYMSVVESIDDIRLSAYASPSNMRLAGFVFLLEFFFAPGDFHIKILK